jgi:iron uptake system component EfeO
MSRTRLVGPLAVAACAAALAACSSGASTPAPAAPASAAPSGVAPVTNGASQVAITLTGDNGGSCALDNTSAAAGPVTFTVSNKSATSITEVELQNRTRILGEKENLAPGLPAVSFTLTLGGGDYQLYCPGASTDTQNFTVTGQASGAPTGTAGSVLADGTTGYGAYVTTTVDAMSDAVTTLKTDIDAGDLDKAKTQYGLARPFYERVESDVDGFILPGHDATDNAGNLDYLIDMRESNLDPAVGWHGFHAIEKDLFQAGQITESTKQLGAELQTNVTQLDGLVKELTYKPEDLANGAADLLEEVQSNKITGEEENYSHIDLVDFAGNVEGAQQAFAFLEPGMEKIDATLAEQVTDQFTAVTTMLDTYRDPSAVGGYKTYTDQLRASDGPKLSAAVQALQEPLSQIAEKVATAGS